MKVDLLTTKNSANRRRFLQAMAAGSISIVGGGLGNFSTVIAGQSSCTPQLQGWDPSHISNAALDHVGTELGGVYRAIQSRGSVRADDVRTMASNLRLLFGHFEEIRFTPVLERQMRECRQGVLDFVPPEEQLRRISEHLVAFGISLPPAKLREVSSLSAETKARALGELERKGIRGFVEQALATLDELARRLEQQQAGTNRGTGTVAVHYVRTSPFQDGFCQGLQEAIDIMILITLAVAIFGTLFPPAEILALDLFIYLLVAVGVYLLVC